MYHSTASSLADAGTEMPRRTGQSCVLCGIYHGMRHLVNGYDARKGATSCSRWRAEEPFRLKKVDKTAASYKKPRFTHHPSAEEAYHLLIPLDPTPDLATYAAIANAIQAEYGVRPFLRIHEDHTPNALQLYVCTVVAGAFRWGLSWSYAEIAQLMRASEGEVARWAEQARVAIVMNASKRKREQKRIVADTKFVCEAIADVLAPPQHAVAA